MIRLVTMFRINRYHDANIHNLTDNASVLCNYFQIIFTLSDCQLLRFDSVGDSVRHLVN